MTTKTKKRTVRVGLARGAPVGNKRAVGNRGGPGAPLVYHTGIPEACYRMALLGAIDTEMADVIGVSVETLHNWKREHPELVAALKLGKTDADAGVAHRLFQKAMGYEHKATKIFLYEGQPVKVPYVERYAPDTAAARYWLNNRRPQQWRDRQADDGAPPMTVTFTIIGLNEEKPSEPKRVASGTTVQARAFDDPAKR
jgi:hypothetical protein